MGGDANELFAESQNGTLRSEVTLRYSVAPVIRPGLNFLVDAGPFTPESGVWLVDAHLREKETLSSFAKAVLSGAWLRSVR